MKNNISSNQTLTCCRGRALYGAGADAGSTGETMKEGSEETVGTGAGWGLSRTGCSTPQTGIVGRRTSVDLVFFNVIFKGTVYPPREFFPPRFLDDGGCYRSRLSYGLGKGSNPPPSLQMPCPASINPFLFGYNYRISSQSPLGLHSQNLATKLK
ncbi:hypothetical protein CEXT_229401 [Caerostris extrusa]|uniref:Uncharacterized protein n=1 Tax=Caerostris extrusa TaxID=172846 RepID=A0AAV4XCA5_CAEEX|nr:hypothetical protein CEXT_229401 [Caerostris extrusa]